MQELEAISPIDGRYRAKTQELTPYFSESALIRYRTRVEIEYLIALSLHPETDLREFSQAEIKELRSIYQDFDLSKAQSVKDKEAIINHDVKAVEYFIKDRLQDSPLQDTLEWIHFALTSEDINNISYALMLSESVSDIITPSISKLVQEIDSIAETHKDLAMLARTHGQAASPTTFGKEFKVFSTRIQRQLTQLQEYKILAKLNGATGNYNAHLSAYPNIDWHKFTQDFITGLSSKLEPNLVTTQIESHDTYAELFDILSRINTILIGFNQDIWRYISDGWIIQKANPNEVGSSTMPHKVNPIDFENSEGNLGLANTMFSFFSSKLPISRLQRDLSDSTVQRNFGIALAYSLIAYKSTLKGLSKIAINESKISSDLDAHPEIVAEAIQTILRREGLEVPYEQLKNLTRGKEVSLEDFREFIDNLDLSESIKEELRHVSPSNYIGLAAN